MSSSQPPQDADRRPASSASDAAASADGLSHVADRLGRIEELLRESAAGDVGREIAALASTVAALNELVQRGFEHLAELLAPHAADTAGQPAAGATSVRDVDANEPAPAPGASGEGLAAWERAILGDALADDEALAFQRRRFVQEVLEGRPAACGLAGSLLALRAAAAERMAQLLKEIGESYYRWQPKQGQSQGAESSAFEEALAGWLQRRCEAAGLSNTI